MNCRHCDTPLTVTFADLGSALPSNAYLTASALQRPERWFPLRVLVCTGYWLVQTEDYAAAEELFTEEFAFFSSYSIAWLAHAEHYVDTMVSRFHLGSHNGGRAGLKRRISFAVRDLQGNSMCRCRADSQHGRESMEERYRDRPRLLRDAFRTGNVR